ncbi:Adenosine deaminase [Plasmodiophora brassicae]
MRRQVEAILEEIAALPKVELHRHLDGGIRDQLLFDTARRRNMKLPDAVTCADDLAAYTSAGETCQSLTEFLQAGRQTFIFFTPIVRGDRIALRQMALDTCEDLASNNIIYAELRYSPHLLADDNLSASEVVALICDAVREGSARFGIRATTILCAMRHFPEWTSEVVDLAHQFRNNGVVGIDIAGDERHSCLPHRKEFARAKSLGLKITAHASEAGPAHEIVNAVEHLHAERIGHGYHCVHDEAVYKFVRDQRLHLECCVTSSLLTNAVLVPVDQHPVRLFSADGVSFSLSTDDPSVCRTTLNRELQVAAEHVGLSFDDIVRAMVNAAQAAFLPESDRQQLVDTITKHAALAATRILSASPSS